jgi:Fe-S oxidoreductase
MDASRLAKQTFLLSEFLDEKKYSPPPLPCEVVLHGHCHQKSVLKFDAEQNVLKKMGASLKIPDSGCCGMAGAFGFEKQHYDVSMACGERVLLPAVRASGPETLVVTSGFSCHEQIVQSTDKRPLHFAEVLKLAIDRSRSGQPSEPMVSSAV